MESFTHCRHADEKQHSKAMAPDHNIGKKVIPGHEKDGATEDNGSSTKEGEQRRHRLGDRRGRAQRCVNSSFEARSAALGGREAMTTPDPRSDAADSDDERSDGSRRERCPSVDPLRQKKASAERETQKPASSVLIAGSSGGIAAMTQ